jgi:hypothetical protein
VASEFDGVNNLIKDKQTVEYTASHIIIMQPELIHAGVAHEFLSCGKSPNMRVFISIGSKFANPRSQTWYLEEGNQYGLPPGEESLKKILKDQVFSLASDCSQSHV